MDTLLCFHACLVVSAVSFALRPLLVAAEVALSLPLLVTRELAVLGTVPTS